MIRHALSPSFLDVKTAVDASSDDDTVIVDPGPAADWGTSSLVVNNNVRIVGQGPGQTIIKGSCLMITFNTKYKNAAGSPPAEVGLSKMTIDGACNSNPPAQILVTGFSQNVRIDHIVWEGAGTKVHIGNGWTNGVIDHCVSGPTLTSYPNYTFSNSGVPYGESIPAGYGTEVGTPAWMHRGVDFWASPRAWYVEDNVWINPQHHWCGTISPGGAIFVGRHNSSNSQFGLHGTDTTGSYRCVRTQEEYNNYFDIPASVASVEFRDGSGNLFNNRFAHASLSGGTLATRITSYRGSANYGDDYFYNSADGTGIFDINDRTTTPLFAGQSSYGVCDVAGNGSSASNKPCVPASPSYTGTIFLSGTGATFGSGTITLPGMPLLTTNQLTGYVVRSPNATPNSGTNKRQWVLITEHPSHSAGTITLPWEGGTAAGGTRTIDFPGGDWEIRRPLNTFDECGAGKTSFVSNKPTTNHPDVPTKPISIEREYIFQWGNLLKANNTDDWRTQAVSMDNAFGTGNNQLEDGVLHTIRGLRNGYRDVGWYDGPGTNVVGGTGDHAYPAAGGVYPTVDLTSLTSPQQDAYFRIGADDEAFAMHTAAGGAAISPQMYINRGDPAGATSPDSTHYPGYIYPHPLVAAPTPVINSASSDAWVDGVAGRSFQVTTQNFTGSPTFTKTGTLPAGVTLSSGGLLSGTPSGVGSYPITITATSGSQTAQQSFTLTITAAATKVIALTGSMAFGSVTVGTTVMQSLTITNSGNTLLTVSGITYPNGFIGNWSNGTIAAGASQIVSVTFSPVAGTSYSGTITVASDKTSGTNTVAASGTGAARIMGLAGDLAFGDVTVGQMATRQLTISNSGNVTLNISAIAYPPNFSGDFSTAAIAAGASKILSVTFSPDTAQAYAGTVDITSDKTNGTSSVAASGNGVSSATKIIQLTGDMAFGNVLTGTTLSKPLTVSNSGNATLNVSAISVPSGYSADLAPAPPPTPMPTASYYVDSVNGSDANSGSQASPWKTIQKSMTSAIAGSTVNIKGGTYHERLTLNVSGTSGSYITFQPFGYTGLASDGTNGGASIGADGYKTCVGDQVILDYAYLGTVTSDSTPFFNINNKSYVIVQGLTFQNYTCDGAFKQGVRIDGGSHDVQLLNNRFLHNKNIHATKDGTAALLHIRIWGSNNITLRGNELGDLITQSSEALTMDSSSCVNATIESNYIHDTDGIGIDLHGGANNCLIRGNLLEYISVKRDNTVWWGSTSNVIYVDGGNTTTIERNLVRNSGYGVAVMAEPGQPDAHGITVRDNVFHSNLSAGIEIGTWYSNTDGSTIYNINILNNTSYNNANGILIRPYTSASVVWKNNIIANNTTNIVNTLNWPIGTINYNSYFGSGGVGPDTNKITTDPKFTNTAASPLDLSIQSISPAKDAGDPSFVAGTGETDFLGHSRVAGGAVDMGAYEVQTTPSPTAIPAGSSQPVNITFAPTTAAAYNGTITVASDATSGINTAPITGTGVAPVTKVIGLSGNLAFGNVTVGTSVTVVLTIANTGSAVLTVSGITLPAGFIGSFSGTIAAGASQPVNISFSPTAVQSYGGIITVASDATSGANTIAASGSGVAAATKVIAITGNLNFGNVQKNHSVQRIMTITNSGTAALTVTGITFPTAFSGSWSNGTIRAGASQAITVTFKPIAAQNYGGNITVVSDKTSGVNTIACSGSGTNKRQVPFIMIVS